MMLTSRASLPLAILFLILGWPAATRADNPGLAASPESATMAARSRFGSYVLPTGAVPGPASSATAKEASPAAAPVMAATDPVPPPANAAGQPSQPAAPLKPMGKAEILRAKTDAFAAYLLKGNERTVVLDLPTLRAQGHMFARVILFIERDGTSRTRLMTVPEVRQWLAQHAHSLESLTAGNNFRAGELARFFNTARFQREPLTVDEQRLYDWMLQAQLLREEPLGVTVAEPEAMLITIPQASAVDGCAACTITPAQRQAILEHELAHARFATDTAYANYSAWFWSHGMDAATRGKFTQFLRARGYDALNSELLANEMQAFLMHTPDPLMFGAAALGMTEAELQTLRDNFQAGLFPKPPAVAAQPYRFD